jgi:uncharacterized protein YjbJ (UPF0337 family)
MRAVNWDQLKGTWHQVRGSIPAKWGDLTDDEIEQIDGNREIMVGKIQERYGVAKKEAARQVEERSKSHD